MQPPVPEEHANLLSMLPMSSIAIGLARIVREILNRLAEKNRASNRQIAMRETLLKSIEDKRGRDDE